MKYSCYNINVENNNPTVNFMGGNPAAPLSKPIETVQQSIEHAVDNFAKKVDEEKEKKSNKKAIAVGSSVIVLSALVAIINPRISNKIIGKLGVWQKDIAKKIADPNKSTFSNKFYKACAKGLNFGMRGLLFTNNFNSVKDIYFKWICTKEKSFDKLKSGGFKDFMKKIDKCFIKIMTKPYNAITKAFDYISKKTVLRQYKKSLNSLDRYEAYVRSYMDRFSPSEQQEILAKLEEAKQIKKYFSAESVNERLTNQEELMKDLESKFMKKAGIYRKFITKKSENKVDYIDKNLSFWAEDIMKPIRDEEEQKGINTICKMLNHSSKKPGVYDQILDILRTKLSYEETIPLEKTLLKCHKRLNKANNYEYVKYFDKKRDLVLGSAPTDVLSALAGLSISGIAIGTADDKEERISRTLTGGFPIVAGLGASMAYTAMLVSGVQSMIYGALTSIFLSKTGSIINHQLIEKPTVNKKI